MHMYFHVCLYMYLRMYTGAYLVFTLLFCLLSTHTFLYFDSFSFSSTLSTFFHHFPFNHYYSTLLSIIFYCSLPFYFNFPLIIFPILILIVIITFLSIPPGRKVEALRRCTFRELPPTLIIHLKRFEFNIETMDRKKVRGRAMISTDF